MGELAGANDILLVVMAIVVLDSEYWLVKGRGEQVDRQTLQGNDEVARACVDKVGTLDKIQMTSHVMTI